MIMQNINGHMARNQPIQSCVTTHGKEKKN